MPDQSSASTEHAIMQEITAPLATLPDDPVPIVADVDFPLALRGYDRLAVDAYVRKTSQLVAELQATRSPEAAVRRALERVGEEVSGILQRAHETAAQITTQSRSEAEDRLETARREAAQIIADARTQLRELDAETDRIWAERHRLVEDTRGLAGQLVALADGASERFPAADEPEPETPSDPGTDGEVVGELPLGDAIQEAEEGRSRDEGPYDHASESAQTALGDEPDQARAGGEPHEGHAGAEAPDSESTAIIPPVTPAENEDHLQ